MGGPTPKRRAQAENQGFSSDGSSSASRDPTQRSEPKSINKLDGNRDPTAGVLDYTRPTDLKNISEFLGLAGWYAARGVSTNPPAYARMFPRKHFLTTPLVCHRAPSPPRGVAWRLGCI